MPQLVFLSKKIQTVIDFNIIFFSFFLHKEALPTMSWDLNCLYETELKACVQKDAFDENCKN